MALVVQTDDGTAAGANAYASVAEFKAYHTDRGNAYSAYSDPQISAAIIRATDFLDTRFSFRGVRLTTDQTTEWPRKAGSEMVLTWFDIDFLPPLVDAAFVALVGPNGEDILGIPDAVKRAVHEYAFRALGQPLFQDAPAPEGGRLINQHTVRVDVIEESITYAPSQSGSFAMPAFPQADMWLARAGLIETSRTLYR